MALYFLISKENLKNLLNELSLYPIICPVMARTKHNGNRSTGAKMGRPTTYNPQYVEQVEAICAATGANNEALAKIFHVNPVTILRWIEMYPEFCSAIRDGRWEYDSGRVVRSLLQRAIGYEFDETSEVSILVDGIAYVEVSESKISGETKTGIPIYKQMKILKPGIKRTIQHKRSIPSVTAIMYWLQNRQPELWKNVQSQIVEGHMNLTIKDETQKALDTMGKEDLREMREKLVSAVKESIPN